jgi:hypothetical protein
MEDVMDELKLESLEPLEKAEHKENQVATPPAPVVKRWNVRRWFLPAGIVLLILFVFGIYLLIAPASDKLVAQVFRFEIRHKPDTARVVMSIANRQEKQAIIVQLYPVLFGNENFGLSSRSIECATIESVSLPFVLNPDEVRTLKINFSIEKKELDKCADKLKDSSHIVIFQNGPLPRQLEGFLGLGWRVVDGDGNNYTNTARLAYYILTPTPLGFKDSTALSRSWILSDDPFELCTQEDIMKEGE